MRELKRLWLTEWRYTYRSARRDGWSRRKACRMWIVELYRGVSDLPNAIAER